MGGSCLKLTSASISGPLALFAHDRKSEQCGPFVCLSNPIL